jgi:hypothetical protein
MAFVERLRHVRDLLAERLNLVGIRHVLELEDEVRRLREEIDRMKQRA